MLTAAHLGKNLPPAPFPLLIFSVSQKALNIILWLLWKFDIFLNGFTYVTEEWADICGDE